MTKFVSPHRIATHPLKSSINSVEAAMAHLNSIVDYKTVHTPKYIKGSTRRSGFSMLESMASPVIRSMTTGFLGTSANQTSSFGSFNLSQGQIMADLASSVSRASRRYL